MGAAVVIGQLASSNAFAGVDSAAHMAEEVCIFVHITEFKCLLLLRSETHRALFLA
jgi:hypothetical protein